MSTTPRTPAVKKRKRTAKRSTVSPPKPSVSELDTHLGFWLRFVSNHVSARFSRLVEERGVSVSEWVALRVLYSSEKAELSASTLIETLAMTKGAVSKILARLEAKKLIHRGTHREDRRAQMLALSASGRELVPALAALADANDEHFFGSLSSTMQRTLRQALELIAKTHHLKTLPTE